VFYRVPGHPIKELWAIGGRKIDVNNFPCYTLYNMEQLVEEYLRTLTPKQYKAYQIAKDHLKDSFQTEKSNGFLEWHKKRMKEPTGGKS
jgi:hypothetical protein